MQASDLELYLPEPGWFRHHPGGIHGVGHVSRVLVWASRIAGDLAMPSAIRCEELLWAAACHDVGRLNDWTDPGHGTRSAHWVAAELLRRRPQTGALDLGLVQELCRWHEVPDSEIERMTLELLILKDADGLDRVRIHDLDPERLRLQVSRRLVPLARELEVATRGLDEQGGPDVLRAAAHVREGV